MPKIHTHYDNLKVTRNAPPEVIRAAYKSLSQKFHPDRNPGDPGATRTFQIINTAYEVLSDPLRRREHDEWIANEEAALRSASKAAPHSSQSTAAPGPQDGHPGHGQRAAPDPRGFSQADLWAQHFQYPARSGWRARTWPQSFRRLRSASALRQASGYIFLTAVATLVVLGIMLG